MGPIKSKTWANFLGLASEFEVSETDPNDIRKSIVSFLLDHGIFTLFNYRTKKMKKGQVSAELECHSIILTGFLTSR